MVRAGADVRCSAHVCRWPITSISQFSPRPLLVEPDMADLRLRLLDLDAEREGGQHVGELHVHHAQRQCHTDSPLQVKRRQRKSPRPRKEVFNRRAAFLGARLRIGSAPHGLFPSHRGRQGPDRPRPWSFSRIAPGRSPLPHRLARLHAIGDACGQDTLPIGPSRRRPSRV